MKRLLTIALACFCALACKSVPQPTGNPEIDAVRELTARILPGRWADIDYVIEPAGTDYYSLETVGGRLRITGNNANSLAFGLGDYLRDWCHVTVTWFERDKVQEPSCLPVVETKVTRRSVVPRRFFLNYCTYGYSLNWWQWKDWERLIDWMALNGVTMALANTGQEYVWEKVWTGFGLSEQQVREYFVGPSYLSWHRMTNIDGWHGPLPQEWLDGQRDLQKRIIERETSLGISPILSSFTGHVPAALKEKYPDADIRRLNAWGGFEQKYNPSYLSPLDPLFKDIQKAFMTAQKEIFGQDTHVYGVDLFNEVDPPVWDAEYLGTVARKTYEAMAEVDPDAVWLQMSWLFWHKRKNWTPDLVEAYLSPVPKHRLLMLDYYCERVEIYRQTDRFHGQDFIWSYLGNFGGNTMIAGDFDDICTKLDKVRQDGGEEFAGIGCTLEGLDVNPMMYEYVLGRAWDKVKSDSEWVDALADRHMGFVDGHARKAWHILADKVYCSIAGNRSGMIGGRPTLKAKSKWNSPELPYDNTDLYEAWGELLAAKPSSSPSYRFDCVNVGRQYLDNRFCTMFKEIKDAYAAGDAARTDSLGKAMTSLLDDVDRLVGTDAYFLTGKWIADARSWGSTPEAKDYYEWDAKCILSCWGDKGGHLVDYANRNWQGLVSTYYKPRWERFVSDLSVSLETGVPFDEDAFVEWSEQAEWDWIGAKSDFLAGPAGDPVAVSRELHGKYRLQ